MCKTEKRIKQKYRLSFLTNADDLMMKKRSKINVNKKKADLLWKTLDMKYNAAAGYVSYKNLNNQLGSEETKFHATPGGNSKLKETPSWKKSYRGFTAVQKRGFCISTVTDSIVKEKIDELHNIISSRKFYDRDEATPAFNSIFFEDSEELREYNKPPYEKEEYKIDGGRNMLLVTKLQDSDPMEMRGKQLSQEIGEYLRLEVLKNLNEPTDPYADGMVLTWLETQGPVDGDKVDYKVLELFKV